jgi:insulysin
LPGLGHCGIRIVIQSERGPGYLEERVESFLDGMKGTIEDMSNDEFEEQRSGLTKRWREAPKNLGEEASKYWNHVDTGYLDFLRCMC